jgi:hypothetical protein
MLDRHLLRLLQGVDGEVVAVAPVRQLLQRRILDVAHAIAEYRQHDSRIAFFFDQPGKVALAVMPTLKSPSAATRAEAPHRGFGWHVR